MPSRRTCCLVLAATLAACGSAAATTPGSNGMIAFVNCANGACQSTTLYGLVPGTGAIRPLAAAHSLPQSVDAAAFAPGGAYVYYTRHDRSLHRVRVSGASRTLLATLPSRAFGIAVSPDGANLALGLASGVGIVSASGGGLHLITQDDASVGRLDWSPDGAQIAYTARDGIHVVAPDGSSPAVLVRGSSFRDPSYSPDGTRIAYLRCPPDICNIQVVLRDGTHRQNVTPDADSDNGPVWSPDGRFIAFSYCLDVYCRFPEPDDGIYRITYRPTGLGTHRVQLKAMHFEPPVVSWQSLR